MSLIESFKFTVDVTFDEEGNGGVSVSEERLPLDALALTAETLLHLAAGMSALGYEKTLEVLCEVAEGKRAYSKDVPNLKFTIEMMYNMHGAGELTFSQKNLDPNAIAMVAVAMMSLVAREQSDVSPEEAIELMREGAIRMKTERLK